MPKNPGGPPESQSKNFVKRAWSEEEKKRREEALRTFLLTQARQAYETISYRLDSARLRRDVATLVIPSVRKGETFDDGNARKEIEHFFGPLKADRSQASLADLEEWVRNASDVERRRRGSIIEEEIEEKLARGETMNLSAFLSLPELEVAQGASLFSPEIAAAVQRQSGAVFATNLVDLAHLNDDNGNAGAHRLLEFFEMYWTSWHNITPPDGESYRVKETSRNAFGEDASAAVRIVHEDANSYLMRLHAEDALESANLYTEKKRAFPVRRAEDKTKRPMYSDAWKNHTSCVKGRAFGKDISSGIPSSP